MRASWLTCLIVRITIGMSTLLFGLIFSNCHLSRFHSKGRDRVNLRQSRATLVKPPTQLITNQTTNRRVGIAPKSMGDGHLRYW